MLNLRLEQPADLAAIRRINDLAFGGDAESALVDDLRRAGGLTLSLVAERSGEPVGHLAFSPVTVESSLGTYAAMGLAPLAVLPQWQNQGVGGRLVREGLMLLAADGHQGVVVLGHPGYYPRFGFGPASGFGLRWTGQYPDEAFMALEFRPGFFSERGGVVRYHPAFDRFS